jgi:hypothetical protein
MSAIFSRVLNHLKNFWYAGMQTIDMILPYRLPPTTSLARGNVVGINVRHHETPGIIFLPSLQHRRYSIRKCLLVYKDAKTVDITQPSGTAYVVPPSRFHGTHFEMTIYDAFEKKTFKCDVTHSVDDESVLMHMIGVQRGEKQI